MIPVGQLDTFVFLAEFLSSTTYKINAFTAAQDHSFTENNDELNGPFHIKWITQSSHFMDFNKNLYVVDIRYFRKFVTEVL